MERRHRKASKPQFGENHQQDLRAAEAEEITANAVEAGYEDQHHYPVPYVHDDPAADLQAETQGDETQASETPPSAFVEEELPAPDASPDEDPASSPADDTQDSLDAEPAEFEVIEDPEPQDSEDSQDAKPDAKPEMKPSHRQLPVAAYRAKMIAPTYLSLPQAGGAQTDGDPLSHVWSAMADIGPGETAIVRYDFRAYPDYRAEAGEWIHQKKHREEPTPSSRASGLGFVLRGLYYLGWSVLFIFRFLLEVVLSEATRNSKSRRGGWKAPEAPWSKSRKQAKQQPEQKQPPLTAEERDEIKHAEDKKQDPAHYELDLRVAVVGHNYKNHSEGEIHNLSRVAKGIASGFNGFNSYRQGLTWNECNGFDALLGLMDIKPQNSLLVSNDELAELGHVPDDRAAPHGLNIVRSPIKPLEPTVTPTLIGDPRKLTKGAIPIGTLNAGSEDEQVVGMNNRELDQHGVCFGRTGVGKSALANWMGYGMASADYPVILLDPHGALGDDFINMIATYLPERVDDVILIDTGDQDYPPAFNPLDVHSRDQIEPAVEQVMQMLSAQGLNEQNAPRATPLARKALMALASANVYAELSDANRLTLHHTTAFLQNNTFRHLVMEFCPYSDVRETFDADKGSYNRLTDMQRDDHTSVITRVFQDLRRSEQFSRVFATTNRLDFADLINRNKIIIAKMARFTSGAQLGEMLAQMLLPAILGSMNSWGRIKDPETGKESGRGCRILIDEAPAVVRGNTSVEVVLAEARKWDAGLMLFAQFPDQFDPELRKHIFGNTASKITLALGPNNVAGMDKELSASGALIEPSDISGLPNFHAYASLLVGTADGKARTGPFAVQTLPPAPIKLDSALKEAKARIIENSRNEIAVKAEVADKRLAGDTLVSGSERELNQKLAQRVADDPDAPVNVSRQMMDDKREFDLALDQEPTDAPIESDFWTKYD